MLSNMHLRFFYMGSLCCNILFYRFADAEVSRMLTVILKNMFNGSWTTWKEVNETARNELWVHFKVCAHNCFQ